MAEADRISTAWSRARSGWRGQAADAFYREYIRPMQDSVTGFDTACAVLEENTRKLEQALADIEREAEL